jgi:cbb3-type cytochrome oxidase subunit 3
MKHIAERIAEFVTAVFFILAIAYVLGHVYHAAMRHAFQVVTR